MPKNTTTTKPAEGTQSAITFDIVTFEDKSDGTFSWEITHEGKKHAECDFLSREGAISDAKAFIRTNFRK